jgi:hypothetical protein
MLFSSSILETLAGPDGKFAFQVPAAKVLAAAIETYNGGLNASDMGVGKTHSSLAACLLANRPVGVVCPKPCVAGWERAFAHFGATPLFIGGYEEVKRGSRHYNRAGWHLPLGAVVIWDEAHACKDPQSQNTEMFVQAWRSGIGCLMLSATIADSPTEMWGTGLVLGLHDGTPEGYEAWLAKMGCIWNDDFKKWYFPPLARPRLEAIRAHIFDSSPPRGVRITVDSLGEAFPPSDIKCIPVELTDQAAAKIAAAWKACNELVARLERQGGSAQRIVMLKRAAWAKAYEASQTAKVEWLVAKARAGVEAGFSVPIFCNYTSTREAVMRGLNTRCGIFGGQNAKERERHRLDFQQDRQRIIACQIQSGGTGLDLHDVESAFPRFSLILPCPKWKLVEQATGRVRRAGGGPSTQRIIYAAGTVEATMCRRHAERLANLRAIVGSESSLCLED